MCTCILTNYFIFTTLVFFSVYCKEKLSFYDYFFFLSILLDWFCSKCHLRLSLLKNRFTLSAR